MKHLYKMIFDEFFGDITLINDALTNLILVTIIGTISFVLAYRFVGSLYRESFISGRGIGSFIHWLVRALIFSVQIVIVRGVMIVFNWIGGLFT